MVEDLSHQEAVQITLDISLTCLPTLAALVSLTHGDCAGLSFVSFYDSAPTTLEER